MADSQVPWGVAALEGKVIAPAWKVKPSWYLAAADDRMIPPPAQRQMANRAQATTVRFPAATPSMSPTPAAVAELIEQAAADVGKN
jgi:hypothetical protein